MRAPNVDSLRVERRIRVDRAGFGVTLKALAKILLIFCQDRHLQDIRKAESNPVFG
jgi:hypothetical protein